MMFVDLDLYRAFHYVARAGTISGAARELFLSQPAVSQAIKRLETQLDVKLLLRTSKGVRLTKEGEILDQHIAQAYSLMESAERKIRDVRSLGAGEIRIGASDTICKHYLIPYLEAFHRTYPKLRIHVTNRTTPETIALLQAGKVDLGVINLPVEAGPELVMRETLVVHDCFVAGGRYRDLGRQPMSLKDLSEHPILMLETASNTRRYVDRWALGMGVRLEPEIELGSIDLLVEFACVGLGVACVVREFVEQEIKTGRLCEVRLTEPIPQRNIGVVTLKGVGLSVAAATFAGNLTCRD